MLFDGIKLVEGSELQNLVVASGTSFPTPPSQGELFYRTDGVNEGLYVYNDTAWLRIQDENITVANVDGAAPLDSPHFTGIPTAPTAAGGTNTTQLATTAFVTGAVGGINTVAQANKWTTARNLILNGDATGTLASVDGSANVTAALTLATVNSNIGTFNNVTVNGKGLVTGASNVDYQPLDGDLSAIAGIAANTGILRKTSSNNWSLDTTTYAPNDSPNLTGVPLAPTAAGGTNTTQIATTAFVTAAVGAISGGSVASADKWTTPRNLSMTGDVTGSFAGVDGSANASTALTLATVNSNVGTFGLAASVPTFTVNGKGLITAASNTPISINASQITAGTLTAVRGGTGLTSYVIGDLLYADSTSSLASVAGNATTTKKFLNQTGTGSASATPTWSILAASDIPNLDWTKITSGKPTTVAGYGITDAELTSNKNAASGYVGLNGMQIVFNNLGQTFTSLMQNSNTAARTYTFPDATGTIALTSDIAGKAASGANSDITSLSGLTTPLSIAQGGTGSNTAASARSALSVPERANFPVGLGSIVATTNQRSITDPSTGIGYSGGARIRFANWDDATAGYYADVIDLSTYTDLTGGGYNSLYFDKQLQRIVHKFGAAGATTWTVKNLAYLESPAFTGTPTVPTAAIGDNDTSAASTAFVINQLQAIGWNYTGAGPLIADLDDVNVVSGFYYTNGTTVGTFPNGTVLSGTVIHKIYGASGLQIYQAYNADRIYWRRRATSAWQAWNEFSNVASPAFTGNPTAPTPAASDNDTSIATTAFVKTATGGYLSKSVAGGVDVTLTADEAANATIQFTGALTANINVIMPQTAAQWVIYNATTGAFTLTVKTSISPGVAVKQSNTSQLFCNGSQIVTSRTDYDNIYVAAGSASTFTISNNLSFNSTGQRIIGDFSNATIANQLAFQTSTANSITSVGAIPNGTSQQSQFAAFNNSAPNNAGFIRIGINGSLSYVAADRTGSGTYLPLAFMTAGNERFRLSETANRIQADFSNATQSSRLMFQSSTTNGSTSLGILPNGTSTTSVFVAHETTDASNSGRALFGTDGAASFIQIDNVGTGTVRPFQMRVNGTTRFTLPTGSNAMQIKTIDGNLNNRFAFQDDGTNQSTSLDIIPSGTNNTAQFVAWGGQSSAVAVDRNNASFFSLGVSSAASYFSAGKTGTGTTRPMTFTVDGVERSRITLNGYFLVGSINEDPIGAQANGGAIRPFGNINLRCSSGAQLDLCRASASGTNIQFYTDNGTLSASGNISSNGSTTSFNTSSDYRIKVDPTPMINALESLKQIQFKTWNWETDGRPGEGVIAHELQELDRPIEDAVHGNKDDIDADGKPIYQSVDYSKLVPRIGCSVQELATMLEAALARITQLESRLAAVESK